jgi:hypothetical protein
VLRSLSTLLPAFTKQVPSPLKPVLKPASASLKQLARGTLHVVLDSIRALGLLAELLESVVDDTYLNIDFFITLSSNEQKNSNLSMLQSILSHIMENRALSHFWDVVEEVQSIVGDDRLPSSKRADMLLFKVLYKMIMASGLAISQQTQHAVALMKSETIN